MPKVTTLDYVVAAGLLVFFAGFYIVRRPDSGPKVIDTTSGGAYVPVEDVATFRCSFPSGVIADFVGDRYKTKPVAGLGDSDVFTDIDTINATATFIAEGSAKVRLERGHGTVTFIELSPSGNPIITTIFVGHFKNVIKTPYNPIYELPTNTYLAVTSRHIGDFVGGPPKLSQYYGQCRAVS